MNLRAESVETFQNTKRNSSLSGPLVTKISVPSLINYLRGRIWSSNVLPLLPYEHTTLSKTSKGSKEMLVYLGFICVFEQLLYFSLSEIPAL